MQISQQTYDALMSVKFDNMNEAEFHVIFDIYFALTNEDLSPVDPAHNELVSHLASELQI